MGTGINVVFGATGARNANNTNQIESKKAIRRIYQSVIEDQTVFGRLNSRVFISGVPAIITIPRPHPPPSPRPRPRPGPIGPPPDVPTPPPTPRRPAGWQVEVDEERKVRDGLRIATLPHPRPPPSPRPWPRPGPNPTPNPPPGVPTPPASP